MPERADVICRGKVNVSGSRAMRLAAAALLCAVRALRPCARQHLALRRQALVRFRALQPEAAEDLCGAAQDRPAEGRKSSARADPGQYKARYVDLIFNGLRLGVVTYSNDEGNYQVSLGRDPQLELADRRPLPLRPCAAARVGDVETKGSRQRDGGVQRQPGHRAGEAQGRRIFGLTYLCLPD